MDGLALAHGLVPPPTACSSASFAPRRIQFRRSAAAPSWPAAVKLRCSPALKVQAAKKTFSSFDDMINSDIPVLVDFYATWCGPCQYMAPILNEVGKAMTGKIRIVKVDTEKYPKVASRFGIYELPTFVLFKNGKPIDKLKGAYTKDNMIAHIQQVLEQAPANVVD